MRLANMPFAEMTEALNPGWENRDSRSPALSSSNAVKVDPRRIQEVLDPDPPHGGGPKAFKQPAGHPVINRSST